MVDTGSASGRWAGAATRAPSLDGRTLLVPGPGEGWAGTVYVEAAEAVIWREAGPPPVLRRMDERAAGVPVGTRPPATGAASGPQGDRDRTARRRKGRTRRYAVANGCTRLATFTYAEGTRDRGAVKADWARFARELKARWPNSPWLRALELHPGGHGYHVHAAFGGRVPLRQRTLQAVWGHGIVDIRKVRSKRGGREDARQAARYVAKYATKALEADPGEHGYEVAQGFQPVAVRIRGWDREDARRGSIAVAGGEVPRYEWSSGDTEDWTGPPVGFLGW